MSVVVATSSTRRGLPVAALTAALLSLATASDARIAQGVPPSKGCEYANDAISSISYRFHSMYDAYETAFQSAAQAWNNTSNVPGHFTLSPQFNGS